ncbi:MoxR family ATPase [Acidiferrobacter sp.]|uniref:AAA family ATPase n=1 Tax=Acidiferrobacter sp. TaxID=1872107 RepID=UPI00261CFA31|nr:MoxR family ATPase [Acidiferrobacter sp.]
MDTPISPQGDLGRVQAALETILVGKAESVRLALCCALAGGHLLLEDVPGVGKTTLAYGLQAVLGLGFTRLQFTADLLPADVIGVSIFDPEARDFTFHRGPIFTQLLLADEINRATPKTQSALLEALAEGQVTVDGTPHRLPQPFFVVATQNPHHQVGTFALPESQMDRFLMRLTLGYPDRAAERQILTGGDRRAMARQQAPLLSAADLLAWRERVQAVRCSEALLDYIQDLLAASRAQPDWDGGFSPRAGLALRDAARAHAVLKGRDYGLPEDVQAVAVAVLAHRLPLTDAEREVRRLLESVAVP